MRPLVPFILIALIFVGIAVTTFKIWTLGGDESDFSPVCIGGHVYYRANFANKAMMGIQLDDDGKPVKCKIGEQ